MYLQADSARFKTQNNDTLCCMQLEQSLDTIIIWRIAFLRFLNYFSLVQCLLPKLVTWKTTSFGHKMRFCELIDTCVARARLLVSIYVQTGIKWNVWNRIVFIFRTVVISAREFGRPTLILNYKLQSLGLLCNLEVSQAIIQKVTQKKWCFNSCSQI